MSEGPDQTKDRREAVRQEETSMDDHQIIALYWARSETAISETAKKYGNYCHQIAWRILDSREDSEECVNDTWLKTWEAIPPARPERLSAFLGRITRNLALQRYEKMNAAKRGSGQVPLALHELEACIPVKNHVEQVVDQLALTEILNVFLEGLSAETRKVFMRRYWFLWSVKEIAAEYGISESKVKVTLHRTRRKLRTLLEKEGIM